MAPKGPRKPRERALDLAVVADGLDPVEAVGIGNPGRDDIAQSRAVPLHHAVEMAEALQAQRGGGARAGGGRDALALRDQAIGSAESRQD